jgi:nicotinamidase-related amidase
MVLATLDPKTALIVVDLQKAIVGSPCTHPIGDVVERGRSLAAAFRRHGLPVVRREGRSA